MKHDELPEFTKAIFENFLLPLLDRKGRDTGMGGDSATASMEEQARPFGVRGIDKYDILSVYRGKHEQAITTWNNSRDPATGKRMLATEPIHMRIVDDMNYLILLWAMGLDDGIMPDPRKTTKGMLPAIRIIINGIEHGASTGERLDYHTLCNLACRPSADTITWRRANGENGALVPGDSVAVDEMMVFNVANTGNA